MVLDVQSLVASLSALTARHKPNLPELQLSA